MAFSRDVLNIDPEAMTDRLVAALRQEVLVNLKRVGAVVAVSGGVDSAVTACLSARAFGPERVIGLILPEREVEGKSETLARELLAQLEVEAIKEDLTGGLEGLGCYARRNEAIRKVIPEFGEEWTVKLVLPHNPLESEGLNIFHVEAFPPGSTEGIRRRLPLSEYLQIVAASNMKQRSRMLMQYYHAERRRFAVVGTHNRTEYDLGFMVRYGDIGVDVHLLIGLYKVQIYQLARYLKVPQAILDRTPTSGTYSALQTEEEFYFGVPFSILDPLLYAEAHDVPASEAAEALSLTPDQVERVYRDIRSKRRTTDYMRHDPAALLDPDETSEIARILPATENLSARHNSLKNR